ncbi:MAG TPA: alpha-L-fucosidase, partial [Bacteroidota bacterium]|nr:alpha-L-fucosidase [Bacteroidota bacterium]
MRATRVLSIVLCASSAAIIAPGRCTPGGTTVLPSAEQVRWANGEIGVIIHFDINVFAPLTFDYARRETLPPPAVFHPSQLNTDQWVASAKNAGATYAVLVAKHGTGFCLWPTRAHGYHVGNTPWRDGK